MIGDPPSFVGALHVKPTCKIPGTPDKFVGAPGTVSVEHVMKLYAPVPAAFTAATSKSYSVPFNSPETMQCIGAVDGNMTAGTVVATVHGVVP